MTNTDTYSTQERWSYVNYLDTGNITAGAIDSIQIIANDEKLPSRARRKVMAGDIVYSTVRPNQKHYGIIEKPLKNMLVSTGFTVIRGDSVHCDTKYLYFFLTQAAIVERLQTIAEHSTSAYPSIRSSDIESLQINLPPINEQRAIAHILGTLDDKIELNRRMSETLEEMARALFKSWFVDFEPVRAKMEGRWKRGQSLPGLPAHLYDLFPDSFEDSELGKIPKGWEVGCVDDDFELTMGQSPPGDTYNVDGDGLPFYQGRADFGFRFPKRRVYCTAPTRLAHAGDTLISVRAPVGDINMASEECAIGRGVAAARHKSCSRSYTFQFIRGLEEVFARFEAEGTVFGSIGKKDFHALPAMIPPRVTVSAFELLCSAIDSRIETKELESLTLTALRDELLPELISGEIRVKHKSN